MQNQNNQNLFSQLNLETAQISWPELERFFAAGMLVQIDASLDLVDVAVKISQDDKPYIESLISDGKIKPVSDSQAIGWQQQNASLWAVVIKPWVLVQDKK